MQLLRDTDPWVPPRFVLRNIDSPVSFSLDGKRLSFMRGFPDRETVGICIANRDGSLI